MTKPFAAGWLDLREPYDRAARSRALLQSLTAWRQGRGRLQVVDLGAGTGANLRCTATALGGEQDWTLLELDPALIEAGRGRLAQATVGWHYRQLDLAIDLERSVDGGVDLITASALLDLVSEAWLERLVKLQRRTGAALLLVLSVDGRIAWTPMEADDRSVSEVVNRHQLTDKGFGPALGARAVEVLHGLVFATFTGSWEEAHKAVLVPAFRKANNGLRPNFMAVGGYDGMRVIVEGLKASKGAGGDALLAAMKGQIFDSPRGPVLIDAQTRDIVQDIYIRKVEKVDGQLWNVEFDVQKGVKDPGKAR